MKGIATMEDSRDSTVRTLQHIFRNVLLGIGFVMFIVLASRAIGTASEPRYVEGQPRSWKEMFVGLSTTDIEATGHASQKAIDVRITHPRQDSKQTATASIRVEATKEHQISSSSAPTNNSSNSNKNQAQGKTEPGTSKTSPAKAGTVPANENARKS